MKLPNTILIGAQKAGTTSLYEWLGQHPNIFADKGMKDYNFFANDEIYKEGLDWFKKSFRGHLNEQIILHGHVSYLYFSEISAYRISKMNKNMKLIVVLRNPIDRAYSAYWDAKKVAKDDSKSFEEAIEKEKIYIKNGTLDEKGALTYIEHGFYAQQLFTFYKYFEKNQIKIILFEDLVNKPEETTKDIFTFLGVEESFQPSFLVKNESALPRSVTIQKILQHIKIPKELRKFLPVNRLSSIKTYLIRNLNVKKVKYPKIRTETKKMLQDIYKEDISKLEDMIGRDLSLWLK